MKMQISHLRKKRQTGNAFVEFALTVLPYFALVFGCLDLGMVVLLDNMLQGAVREGSRFAITYGTTFNGQTFSNQTDAIKAAAQSVSLGFLTGTNANYLQVVFYAPTDLSTPLTGANRNAPGNVVEVRVQNFPWNWMVPLPGVMSGTGLTLGASTSDVLQSLPPGTTSPPTACAGC